MEGEYEREDMNLKEIEIDKKESLVPQYQRVERGRNENG
jgi:hypothetical protein